MLAVVKLRQKGTTKVSKLPSGVFRHMLEYKYPNELLWRRSERHGPIDEEQQYKRFPAKNKFSYDNYLVAVNKLPNKAQY